MRDARPERAEKRTGLRYRCQGSARLREIASGVATWSTITDISLNGCYVEIPTCFRVGAALALTIEVNGLRVEATGQVRAAYPGLGMGISFQKLSNADRDQLSALLTRLSQASAILGVRSAARSVPAPLPQVAPEIVDPEAALQSVIKFFDNRTVLGREDFFSILRKGQE